MRFELNFKSDNYGKKQIDEPFGTSDINFSLKQKSEGMGRDISFSGDEIQFEFTHLRNHELKQLLYYHRKFGFEAIVVLTIEIDPNNKYICDLDFATAETDDLEYFRCKGLQNGKLQVIKRRKEVRVDVLSDLDVDGNYIGGLVPENMLLLAKPIYQTSKWVNTDIGTLTTRGFFNSCIAIEKSGIDSTLSVYQPFLPRNTTGDLIGNFVLLKAGNRLINTNLSIKKVYFETSTSVNTRLDVFLYINNTQQLLETITGTSILLNKDYFVNIPLLERGDTVSFFLGWRIVEDYSPPLNPTAQTSVESITISTESIAYNSVSKSLRLVDVMRQVVKSISGLSINAPRYESLGQFYDNRLLNGNLLRGITNKPFYVSLDDIEKSISEMHADYEINSVGKIFFGIEDDFYTNIESGFFNNNQFSEMTKTYNPKYMINEFGFKYKNYQSLKENEEPNSADTIHGESRFVFFNKAVENKKTVEVDWTRDAFLIEETRKKAIVIKENTASQEDDTIFCVDSINTTFDNEFIETTELQHSYNPSTFRLTLRNDGSINFESLGITVGSYFSIQAIDPNAGTYTVTALGQNNIELNRVLGITSSAGDGTRITKYKYTLSQALVPYTNYTNQGFSETANLSSADSYSNRRYSIKRNIYNYWQSYVATANLYWKDKPLKNTWYKNNGDYVAKYDGVKLTEKEDFIPVNPILSPMMFNNVLFKNVDFVDFISLQTNIRSQRGYIRAIDNNEQVIKLYPQEIEYSILKKELKIKGEEKFEPSKMTIETKLPGFYLVNGQTGVNQIIYSIENEKIYLFDLNRYRLYNGVFWFEVSVNGAFAPDIETLKQWLDLLK